MSKWLFAWEGEYYGMYKDASAQALPNLRPSQWEFVPGISLTPGPIALWESTVDSVWVVVDNIPLIVDARIGYVEPDGNWNLTLEGRVLDYDGNMGSMWNDSWKLGKWKSVLTLIKNLLNVKTILPPEFCTIWLSIGKKEEIKIL